MTRKPSDPVDPLADLRQETPDPTPPEPAPPAEPDRADPPAADALAALGETWTPSLARACAERIATHWHADAIAVQALHKGGTCPCLYLGLLAVEALVVQAEPEGEAGQ